MKYYLKLLSIPLFFLAIYVSLNIFWNIFDLPAPEELVEILNEWFDKYGMVTLFFSSILEGLLLIGGYFPGVLVIFIAVLISDSLAEAMLAVAVGTVGLLIAHVLNYFLGRYGWYRLFVYFGMRDAIEQSKVKLERRGPWAIPLSYWLPSIGALTNTAAGIIGMPFRKFLLFSICSSVFWYSLVGLLVYNIGEQALGFAGAGTANVYVFIVVGAWILLLLFFDYKKSRKGAEMV